MNRHWPIVLVIAASARAFADPVVSPWGSSPYVVAYQPPPAVDRAHRGLTLEIAAGYGSTTLDTSTGGGGFAIGGWLSRDVSLAFRVTEIGSYGFVGASVQYYATSALWAGAGFGGLSERAVDDLGATTSGDGAGGFLRLGYNLGTSGPHALYVSGELQGGSIDQMTRVVGLVAIGYQLL